MTILNIFNIVNKIHLGNNITSASSSALTPTPVPPTTGIPTPGAPMPGPPPPLNPTNDQYFGAYFLTWKTWDPGSPASTPPPPPPYCDNFVLNPPYNINIIFTGAGILSTNATWNNIALNKDWLASSTFSTKGKPKDQQWTFISVFGPNNNQKEPSRRINKENLTTYINVTLPKINNCGYHGVCFDIEWIDSNVSMDTMKNVFQYTKNQGLYVMVSTSWFNSMWDNQSEKDWMNTFLQTVATKKEYVDIYSPQLYSNNTIPDPPTALPPHPWDGIYAWSDSDYHGGQLLNPDSRTAILKASNKVIPSIIDVNDSSILALKKKWIKMGFNNNNWYGYFQFDTTNRILSPPSPSVYSMNDPNKLNDCYYNDHVDE